MKNPSLLALLVFTIACNGGDGFVLPVEEVAADEFNSRYGLQVENVPVIYNEFEDVYTSTVYQDKSLYRLYLKNGKVTSAIKIHPTFPRGQLKVLCIVRLSPTLMEELEYVRTQWEEAQNYINTQHQHLADSFGFDKPTLQFINDNHYVAQSDFDAWSPSNNSVEDFEDFAVSNNLDYSSYDILLFMDLDEVNPSGGSASWKSSFAKVGWFYEGQVLDKEKFEGLAFAAYHHEIGHVWGWEHEWSDPFIQNGFIADPSLFGWTDLDSDGVPEILDEEPYRN